MICFSFPWAFLPVGMSPGGNLQSITNCLCKTHPGNFRFVWEALASWKNRRFRWRETNKVIIAPIVCAWYSVCVLGLWWYSHILFSCPPSLIFGTGLHLGSYETFRGVIGEVNISPTSHKLQWCFRSVPDAVFCWIILDLPLSCLMQSWAL